MFMQFWFVSATPKYVTFSIFEKDLQAEFSVVILSILLMRNEHTFSFLWIYFHTNFIISDQQAPVLFTVVLFANVIPRKTCCTVQQA